MKPSAFLLRAATLATAIFLALQSIPVHADTYEILRLENDADFFAVGIEDSGAAVLRNNSLLVGDCVSRPPGPFPTCYITYDLDGNRVIGSNTLPPDVRTGGFSTSCPEIPAYIPTRLISFAFCGGGRLLYAVDGRYDNPITGTFGGSGLFDGPDPTTDKIGGSFPIRADAAINAFGDIVFDDIGLEEIIEAYDVTTHDAAVVPEPATILLIGTGALGVAASMRRRWFR